MSPCQTVRLLEVDTKLYRDESEGFLFLSFPVQLIIGALDFIAGREVEAEVVAFCIMDSDGGVQVESVSADKVIAGAHVNEWRKLAGADIYANVAKDRNNPTVVLGFSISPIAFPCHVFDADTRTYE